MADEQFNSQDLERALVDMSMLRYFPSDASTRAAILHLLAKMVPHKAALEWLVDQLVNRVGEWKGPAELRGVLCWKYKPADGIEGTSTTGGFTPADGEQQYDEQQAQIAAGIATKLLAAPEGEKMAAAELEQFHAETIGAAVKKQNRRWGRYLTEAESVEYERVDRELRQILRAGGSN